MTDASKHKPIQQLDRQFCTAVDHRWLASAPVTETLVKAIDALAGSGQARSDLVWPGQVDHPALLHAMANLHRRGAGDFQGFRTVIYPVRDRGLADLHRYRVDRGWLKDQAQRVWSQGQHTSSATLFLFDPSSVEDRPEVPRFHPPVRDLIPVFQVLDTGVEWPERDPRIMRDTIRSVARTRRKAIRQNVQAYDDWATAPAAVLGLGARLDRQHRIRRLMEAFGAKATLPGLVMLDGRRKSLNGQDLRPEHLLRFVQTLAGVLSKQQNLPGLWVLFDQPDDWLDFRIHVRQRLALQDTAGDLERRWLGELLSDASTHVHEDNWLNDTLGRTPPSTPIAWSQPYTVDKETAQLASTIMGLIQHPECDADLHPHLWRAYLWLTRVSNLTIPLRSVEDWLVDHPEAEGLHRHWDALEARKGLLEALHRGQAGLLYGEVHHLVKSMETLHQHWITRGQPMVHAFNQALDRITLRQDAVVHVVVRTSLEQDLLTQDYAECGVRFHRTAELQLLGPEVLREPILFTDMNKTWLDHLLFKPEAAPFEWLLTPRTLRWMQRYLGGLVETPDLGPLEARVRALHQVVQVALEQPGMDLFTHRPPPDMSAIIGEGAFVSTPSGAAVGRSLRVTLEDGTTRTLWGNQTVYRAKGQAASMNLEPVPARRLEVGDIILWPDPTLDAAMNQALSEEALARMMVSKTFVDYLRAYHDNLRSAYAQLPGAPDRRPEAIRQAMSDMLQTDIELANVKNWLMPVLQPGTLNGRSYAPHSYALFQAFARVLGLPELFVPTYWTGIVRYRGARRAKGRERQAVLLHCLLHPESARAYCGSEAHALTALHQAVLRQLVTLTAIHAKETPYA